MRELLPLFLCIFVLHASALSPQPSPSGELERGLPSALSPQPFPSGELERGLPSALKPLESDPKWGEPTLEELTMTTYASDSDAEAVELYRKVEVHYEVVLSGTFRTVCRVKCRTKILKSEGERFAFVAIDYRSPKNGIPAEEHLSGLHANGQIGREETLILLRNNPKEHIRGLKAASYHEENGNIVKTILEDDMVNDERLDGMTCRKHFRIPNVKVGSVITYEYTLESEFYYDLRDWIAQRDIPVLYTEYKLSIPEWLDFNIEASGIENLEQNTGKGTINNNGKSLQTREYTFKARNLPALREAPLIPPPHSSPSFLPYIPPLSGEARRGLEYATKVTHELRDIYIPQPYFDRNIYYRSFSAKWDDVDDRLIDDDHFGWLVKNNSPLKNEMLRAGIVDIADKHKRVIAVLELLRQHVRWNGEYALWGKPSSKVVKNGFGNNADINFLCISMLREAGIDAFPIVLRNRNLGSLPLSPTLKYLSTFVVGIEMEEGKTSFFDASMLEDGCLNALPPELLTDRAHGIRMRRTSGWEKIQGVGVKREVRNEWINLQSAASGTEQISLQGVLDTQGQLTGICFHSALDEEAVAMRKRWHAAGNDSNIVSMTAKRYDIQVTDLSKSGDNFFSTFTQQTTSFVRQCQVTGDTIVLNLQTFMPIQQNPFTSPTRSLPVELPYRQQFLLNVSISLPDGYQAEGMSTPVKVEANGITAIIRESQTGNMLNLQYQLHTDKTFFEPTCYQELKELFEMLVNHYGKTIQIHP